MRKREQCKRCIMISTVTVLILVAACGCGTKNMLEEAAPLASGESGNAAERDNETGGEEFLENVEVLDNTVSENEVTDEMQAELEAAKIRHYYAGVLSELVCAGQLPDMEVESPYDYDGEMSDNYYAMEDVDGDGSQELIITYSTASMAGTFEVVYGYNPHTDELRQECIGFPGMIYYDNGIIKSYASHNHSMGMDFWPFALYQYDAESDSYSQNGYVDTWSKEISDTYMEEPFPEELDTDGDGVLYNIQDGADPVFEASVYKYNEADYEAWYASHMDGANEIEPDFQPIDYEYFSAYSKDYFKLLKDLKEQTMPEDSTDIALLYFDEGKSIDDLEQMLSEQYEVVIEQPYDDFEEEQAGKYNGEDVFRFVQMDGGTITYSGKKVDDITVFGIYPGIDEDLALQYLNAYGFYHYGETENSFITGEGLGNRGLWYEAEEGKIISVSTHEFCAFAG